MEHSTAPVSTQSSRCGSGQRCPAAAIQVRTYRLRGAVPKPANDVAFHILVGGND
jgi:hypothetical protein